MVKHGYSKDSGKTWVSDQVVGGPFQIGYLPKSRGKWIVQATFADPCGGTTPGPVTPVTPIPPTPPPIAPSIGKLAVVNASSHSDDEVRKWVMACEKQADTDIAKYWGYSLDVEFIAKGQVIPKADIYCGILNNSDEAGVLGWHDYANHVPSIQIFTAECDKYRVPVSSCISHEFAEMIGDLNCSTTVRGYDEQGRACLYFRENADPVEDDKYGYQIDNVVVSDFILPTWFQKGTIPPYDFKNHCSGPYQILDGGYMLVSYDNGNSWSQIDKFDKANEKHKFWEESHKGKSSRWALYQKIFKDEPLQLTDIEFGKAIAGGTLLQQGKL